MIFQSDQGISFDFLLPSAHAGPATATRGVLPDPSQQFPFFGIGLYRYFLSFHSILNLQTRKAMLGEVKMLI